MARVRTMADLISDARIIADVEAETDRHSDAQLLRWTNEAIAAFRAQASRWGGEPFISTTSGSLVDGTASYALPSDFSRVVVVVGMDTDGDKWPLQPFEQLEREDWTTRTTTETGAPEAYRVEGANIKFVPVPGSGYSYELVYVPEWSDLTTTGTFTVTITGADEWVAHEVGCKIAVRDENPEALQMLQLRKAEIWERVKSAANRRGGGPARRVDSRSRSRWARAGAWDRD